MTITLETHYGSLLLLPFVCLEIDCEDCEGDYAFSIGWVFWTVGIEF